MLSAKQQEAIILLFESQLSQKAVAEKLQVSQNTMSAWQKSPEFLKEYRNMALRRIKRYLPDVIRAEVDIALNGRVENARVVAIKDLLDRANVTELEERTKVEVTGTLDIANTAAEIDEFLKDEKNELNKSKKKPTRKRKK